MNKLVVELLSSFVRRLSPGSLATAALFWGLGVVLFHLFPRALPGCSAERVDPCLIFSGDGRRQAIAIAIFLSVTVITAQGVSYRATEVTQFLTGTIWSRRQLFIHFQDRARERLIKRGYGPRDLSSGSDTRPRPINIRCRLRADRYPHGTPRKPHKDPPRPFDVDLEPTFLGNVFAAMHQNILVICGLRLPSCWKHLLDVLPATERMRLDAASALVLAKTRDVMFSVMTCSWAILLPGHLWKIGWVAAWLTIAYLAYRGLCVAAGKYCDGVKSIVIRHRRLLYVNAGLPVPTSLADELRKGPRLSRFLEDGHRPPVHVKTEWSTGNTG